MKKKREKLKMQEFKEEETLKKSIPDERKSSISASFGLISRRPFHYNVLVVKKKIFVG